MTMATAVLLRSLRRREFSSLPDFRTLSWIMAPVSNGPVKWDYKPIMDGVTRVQQVGRSCKLAMPACSGDRIWKAIPDSGVIVIDLGTTNSCVTLMDGKNPKVIKNPSIVSYRKKGKILVGPPAKRQAITNPINTLFGTKRLIGRRFDDPQTQKEMKMVPFKIVRAPNGEAWVEADGQHYSPIQIGAFILKKMKDIAEAYLGKPVSRAVVTIPTYFNGDQMRATVCAGRIAGLDVERTIYEPIAAAHSYGLKNKEGLVAIIDLGGGTFDISLMEISNGCFDVKAMNSDRSLGGVDFDNALLEFLVSEFKRTEGIDLWEDGVALQRLREAGEKAKIKLSSRCETEIKLPFIRGAKHLNITLSRSKFEALVNHLIERTKALCESCLKDAGISSVDEVVLVGGMSRVPKVRKVVSEIFGKSPSKGVNPQKAVAMGAAIEDCILHDKIMKAFGPDSTPYSDDSTPYSDDSTPYFDAAERLIRHLYIMENRNTRQSHLVRKYHNSY